MSKKVKAGVIDPDFTGNIGVVLKNNSDQPVERLVGEQIAQLLFIKVATPTLIQVTSLAKTEWGEYGFGAHTKQCANAPAIPMGIANIIGYLL